MSAALPSPPATSPGGHPLPVEALQDLLGGLLRERETLRAGGTAAALEANRAKIVACQHQLAQALIARFGTRSA
jgi:hypothetical protein